MKEFINVFKNEKKIKEDFHGNRDLYNFIKEIAIEIGRLSNNYENNVVVNIIEKYIERNFGGIDYEIDIDLKLPFDDIKTRIGQIKKILEDYNTNSENTRKNNNKKKQKK